MVSHLVLLNYVFIKHVSPIHLVFLCTNSFAWMCRLLRKSSPINVLSPVLISQDDLFVFGHLWSVNVCGYEAVNGLKPISFISSALRMVATGCV